MEGVKGEFFDCDGGATGKASLADKAEAVVVDDKVRGEVVGGAGELVPGDLDEVGVEGPASVHDRKGGGGFTMGGGAGSDMGGAGSGLGGVAVVLAEEDGVDEKEGDHEEVANRGDDGL